MLCGQIKAFAGIGVQIEKQRRFVRIRFRLAVAFLGEKMELPLVFADREQTCAAVVKQHMTRAGSVVQKDIAEIERIHKFYLDKKRTYFAEMVDDSRKQAAAWLSHAQGKNEEAITMLREVARIVPDILVDYPDIPAPDALTENWQRRQFYEALARVILPERGKLLLVIDDVQWCDEETLEWLRFLRHFDPTRAVLVIATCRVEESFEARPLESLLQQLAAEGKGPMEWKTIPQGAATSVWAGVVAPADEIGPAYETPFDRSRPLWEARIYDGLAEDRRAFFIVDRLAR